MDFNLKITKQHVHELYENLACNWIDLFVNMRINHLLNCQKCKLRLNIR